jgi:rhamnulokinase
MEVKNGLALAVQKYGSQVVSIGVDTWGVDYALLDSNDELVGNPYHYRDKRTEGMFEVAFQKVPRDEIYRRTGIQFMRLNTLYQLLSMVVQKSPQLKIAKNFPDDARLVPFLVERRESQRVHRSDNNSVL